MNRRTFLQALTAGLTLLGFGQRGEAQDHPPYPAQWLDWYHRHGRMYPVDHSCGSEYEPGELVWMNELDEEPILYRVPMKPAPGTVVTHLVETGGGYCRRMQVTYLGEMTSL